MVVVALALYAGVVTLALIGVRIAWVFPAVYLPRLLFPRIRARDPYPPWQAPAIVSWVGLRGVVSLAAAFAVPLTAGRAPFPGRDLILFLTFVVIVATLVVQGLTLPWVSRRLHVAGMDDDLPSLEQAAAEHTTARLALLRLDQSGWSARRPSACGGRARSAKLRCSPCSARLDLEEQQVL